MRSLASNQAPRRSAHVMRREYLRFGSARDQCGYGGRLEIDCQLQTLIGHRRSRYGAPHRGDDLRRRIGEVAHDLPAARRVGVEEPIDAGVIRASSVRVAVRCHSFVTSTCELLRHRVRDEDIDDAPMPTHAHARRGSTSVIGGRRYGRITENDEPPSGLASTRIAPSSRVTKRFVIASPSPVPPYSRVAVSSS
jgi:hypothetical protein